MPQYGQFRVGTPPTKNELRFARSEDFLVHIDNEITGKHVGAVVFGTTARPYKINLRGKCIGRFSTWMQTIDFLRTYQEQ